MSIESNFGWYSQSGSAMIDHELSCAHINDPIAQKI